MTKVPPRKGKVDDMPPCVVRNMRVFVNGDMPRGVTAYDADEGWADVLIWNDEGAPMHNGEGFVTQRLFGKIEVKAV